MLCKSVAFVLCLFLLYHEGDRFLHIECMLGEMTL